MTEDKQKRLKGDKNLLNFNSASHVSDIYNDRLHLKKDISFEKKRKQLVP